MLSFPILIDVSVNVVTRRFEEKGNSDWFQHRELIKDVNDPINKELPEHQISLKGNENNKIPNIDKKWKYKKWNYKLSKQT